jgi:hypothetical protein
MLSGEYNLREGTRLVTESVDWGSATAPHFHSIRMAGWGLNQGEKL